MEKRPFGIYAIIVMLLLAAAAAALDIVRIRTGFPSQLLQQIAELLREGTILTGLSTRLVADEQVLILINLIIIGSMAVTIVGLWFRLYGAWLAAMLLIGIGLVYNIWNYLAGTPLYLSMLLHVFSVFYLNERSVQLSFERRQAAGAAS